MLFFNEVLIYVTARNVGISDEILINPNYKDMINVEFETTPKGNNYRANLTDGLSVTLTNQTAGEYVSPSYVFDTKKVTYSDIKCHVTGIPYTLNSTSNDSVDPWYTTGNLDVLYWDNGLVLGGVSGGMTAEKKFHLPQNNIDVYVTAKGSVTGRLKGVTGWLASDTTGSIRVGGKSFMSLTVSPKGVYSNPDIKQFDQSNPSMSLTSSNPVIQCSITDATTPAKIQVTSLNVIYR